MPKPRVEYEQVEDGVKIRVFADNGEKVIPVEVYANHSNAKRGLGDLYRTLGQLVAEGEIPGRGSA
jgi:hypothetical protein